MAVVKEEKPEVFFEENETDIFEDDDIVSELIGCSGEESTSSTVLKYILNINEAFNLSSEDIDLLKRIKNRLDDTCVPLDAQEVSLLFLIRLMPWIRIFAFQVIRLEVRIART